MLFKFSLLLALAVPAAAAPQPLSHPYSALEAAAPAPQSAAGIGDGETLEYDIYWGLVYVGRSYLRIDKTVTISSRPVWHIISEARSGSFIENFYKVADRNEAWMDAEDLSSHGYYKKISEGGYFVNEWAVFDRPGRRYFGKKLNRKGQLSEFEGLLENPVNDFLSAVYRLRVMKIAPGEKVGLDINSKRNWHLSVVAGKREKISTDYGKKKCVLLEPMAGEESLFVAKAGKRMLIWITDDELKLPMMLKAEIAIGSITAKLVRRTMVPAGAFKFK